MRACAPTDPRWTPPGARATPSPGSSTRATRTPTSSTSSATSSRCWTRRPRRGGGARALQANQLAFRLKLLLASGLAPHLATCASCGEREHLSGFSGAAGGVVCAACEAGSFTLDEDAHAFMVQALGRPLAQAPRAGERALRQADRAIVETAAHHAGVHLRDAVARVGSRSS
jgi:hypothetical protein